MRLDRRGIAGVAVLIALAACGPAPRPAPDAPNRNALYEQMRTCLGEARLAPPCVAVDRARGFVVIKDNSPAKPDGYLMVPDTEVTGIEDPRALAPPVVAFWSYGWQAGRQLLDRPPEDIGLAINSRAGRTQDLLHIHISCADPSLRDALAGARIGADWAVAPFVEYRGDLYNARKVATLVPSPFLRLRELPGARGDMAAWSLAVLGSADGGYYLLADATEPGRPAAAEELLDQDC
jgi:CDP-diacylglycerol pyrophosphatase